MRRFFTITLTAATLVVVVLWVVSYWWMIGVELPGGTADSKVTVTPTPGRVLILYSRHQAPPIERGPAITIGSVDLLRQIYQSTMMSLDEQPMFEWRSFVFPPRKGVTWSGLSVAFPYWLLVLLFGSWPAYQLFVWFRQHARPGLCRACGYDLRGTPSGVCPECGATNSEC